jgi:hypothetical protein
VIWVKRLSPLVLVFLAWLGYSFYANAEQDKEDTEAAEIVRLTAQTWIATAQYHNDPKQYQAFRDSLLHANGLDNAAMKRYIASIEKDPQRQLDFSVNLTKMVDSLGKIADSVRRASGKKDTVRMAAPIPAPTPPPISRDSVRITLDLRAHRSKPDTARPKAVPIIPPQ